MKFTITMINTTQKFVRSIFFFTFVLIGAHVNAQVSLLQNVITKIGGYKNFGYQSVNKQKDLFDTDTTTVKRQAIFLKVPEDKKIGNLFNIKTQSGHNSVTYLDIYDGQHLLHLSPADSTYQIQEVNAFNLQTLPSCLAWINNRLTKRPSGLTKVRDTIINAVVSFHLLVDVYDTIINKKRNYTMVDLYIDKSSGLPNCIIIKSRNTTFGDGISSYYSESSYFDYKLDQDNIDASAMSVPEGFHLPTTASVLPAKQPELLASGSVAPNWLLSDAAGKKMSLAELKGKVVLLDFFFVGCFGCMKSLKPLNNLHEKYKNQNVAMVSMTFRDKAEAASQFKNNYNIKYPIYIDAAEVVKNYHVVAFPTFYFINKEGKIANIIVGYDDNFEDKVSVILNALLNK